MFLANIWFQKAMYLLFAKYFGKKLIIVAKKESSN
jgi:hypothetical protein